MDDARFDALSRSFTTAHSRRGLARLLGGVTAGSLLTGRGAPRVLAAKSIGGTPCKKGKQCLTRKCVGPKGQKHCACSQKFPDCASGFCVDGRCAPCQRCYFLDSKGVCRRTQDPMNDRCPCGFEEMSDGYCYKDLCQDCFENVGGICVPEPDGTAPNGLCACGFNDTGGVCVPRYPLPPR